MRAHKPYSSTRHSCLLTYNPFFQNGCSLLYNLFSASRHSFVFFVLMHSTFVLQEMVKAGKREFSFLNDRMAFRETNFPEKLLSSGDMLFDDLLKSNTKIKTHLIWIWLNHLNIFHRRFFTGLKGVLPCCLMCPLCKVTFQDSRYSSRYGCGSVASILVSSWFPLNQLISCWSSKNI